MGRPKRDPNAVPGDERSIFDDLKLALSLGSLNAAQAPDLEGTSAALAITGGDASVTLAVKLLRQTSSEVIGRLSHGSDGRYLLGARSLETLLLGETPPRESHSQIRETVGLDLGGSSDSVRRSEEKVLRIIARTVALSLRNSASAPSLQIGADEAETADPTLQLIRFDDTIQLIEVTNDICQKIMRDPFEFREVRKISKKIYPKYTDPVDEVLFDFARLGHVVAEFRRTFFRLGDFQTERTGLHNVVNTGLQLDGEITAIVKPIGTSTLRRAYVNSGAQELVRFLQELIVIPGGRQLITDLRRWYYAPLGRGECAELMRIQDYELQYDNEKEYRYPSELCPRHRILRLSYDMRNIVRPIQEGLGIEWIEQRHQQMLKRARVLNPDTIA